MKLYYYLDVSRRQNLHRAGLDDTTAYIPELLTYLGVTAQAWTEEQPIGEGDILFVGTQPLKQLPSCHCILFGTTAETETAPTRRQPGITDYYATAEGKQLPLFVPILPADPHWEVLRTTAGGKPALIRQGKVCRFCFDLPATVWFSGDGFYTGASPNGFFLGRTPDTRPLPEDVTAPDAYNDLLLAEVEAVLDSLGVPTLYRLPPIHDRQVPDFALHFSGDDDCTSMEFNRNAAQQMQRRGYPYHINAMPIKGEHFIFGKAQLEALNALGCEVALHTDFVEGPVPYTAESQQAQADLFEQVFGYRSRTNTNHCFVQDGITSQRLRWLNACGIYADNGKWGEVDPEGDINAFNLSGFSFGTAFPRYTLDTPENGNRHIDTMEIPINYYEPRLGGRYDHPERITGYLDDAAAYGRISQLFLHPHYFNPKNVHSVYVGNALDLVASHCEQRQYRVLYTTTDRVADFWKGRAASRIDVGQENSLTVRAEVPLVVKLPGSVPAPQVNGQSAHVCRKPGCTLVILPEAGTYTITGL